MKSFVTCLTLALAAVLLIATASVSAQSGTCWSVEDCGLCDYYCYGTTECCTNPSLTMKEVRTFAAANADINAPKTAVTPLSAAPSSSSKFIPAPCNACQQQCQTTYMNCLTYCGGQPGCSNECGGQESECIFYCPTCPGTSEKQEIASQAVSGEKRSASSLRHRLSRSGAAVKKSSPFRRSPSKDVCWEVSACWECESGYTCSGSGDNMLCCPDAAAAATPSAAVESTHRRRHASSPSSSSPSSRSFPTPCNACQQQCQTTYMNCLQSCDNQPGCLNQCGGQESECIFYCPSCPAASDQESE